MPDPAAPTATRARPVTPIGILAAELAEVSDDGGLPAALADRLRRLTSLAAGLDPYLSRCTTTESPELAELARRTRETDWNAPPFSASATGLEQEMLSGHVEGQLLRFLVYLRGARRVLDIGMFTGYSALAMAEALPADGEVVACEADAEVGRRAADWLASSPAGRRVTVAVGPARDTLRRLTERGAAPFELVFLDADKDGYLGYLDELLDGPLLAPGAVIAVDNTLLQGEPYGAGLTTSANGAAIASFNAAVADDPRVEQVMLPLRDGLTLIRRSGAR